MKVYFDNVNLKSKTGASNFAQKLKKAMVSKGVDVVDTPYKADIALAFARSVQSQLPFVQRLDGIYFNPKVNYKKANMPLQSTYNRAVSVIFQSEYNKKFVTNMFGNKDRSYIVHNGTDLNAISKIPPIEGYDGDVWSCCAFWSDRRNKRLKENIEYFEKYSSPSDKLIICGKSKVQSSDRVICLGDVSWETTISVFKRSKYFIHLSWFDSCPNVVVDAKESGCQIICTSLGGTYEIAGENAIVIKDMDWDYLTPIDYHDVYNLDFSRRVKSVSDKNLDIDFVTNKYIIILEEAINEQNNK